MASVFGWWRALLAIIQAKQSVRWIEPSNEITRAILRGQAPTIGRRDVHVTTPAAAPVVTTERPVAAETADIAETAIAEPAAVAIEEAPAATEVPPRSRRRRSHRAA